MHNIDIKKVQLTKNPFADKRRDFSLVAENFHHKGTKTPSFQVLDKKLRNFVSSWLIEFFYPQIITDTPARGDVPDALNDSISYR